MLKPALLYKEELTRLFTEEIYTDDYFLYVGYPYDYSLPTIEQSSNGYVQYAILSKNTVIGYLAYRVDGVNDSVDNFGLYSFDRGNPIIGKDLFTLMETLVKRFRRVEWKMVGGNPVKKSYDKFCKKYNGNIVQLHEVIKDTEGNYRDVFLYEILRKKIKPGEKVNEGKNIKS